MDTRKVTLIATIAAIALVAVGIGYAYTASTLNSNNSVTTEYITIVQGQTTSDSGGAYNFANGAASLKWDAVDSKTGENPSTVFTPNPAMTQGASADHMDSFYIAKLGKSFDILTEGKGTTTTPLTCSITAGGTWNVYSNAGSSQTTTFFLKVENNSITTWFKWDSSSSTFKKWNSTATDWSGNSEFNIVYDSTNTKYYDTTVTVYYAIAGASSITVTHNIGSHPAGPSVQPLNGASLTFTVTKT